MKPELANAIERAAEEVRKGLFDQHFPLTVWQTGSGTQTNMNANEVIANRANELLGSELGTRSPLGQAFDAFSRQVGAAAAGIHREFDRLRYLPQGGTAVGTGINAANGFDSTFCSELSDLTGIGFEPLESKFEAMGAHDCLVATHGALKVAAVALTKIANDVRLLVVLC
ncbi:lyase family protein [Rhodococcus sp. T2V]|uniref:lyase family protein n=1 Tax=Rhodococcus sp. T2V TaxID=3034164 RepID=UPI0023E3463F|nr:lyase family protein [Rhodococcus sp. T2V]MDF3306823.1 lyase family protein [Rhodococcus sp. T2V]